MTAVPNQTNGAEFKGGGMRGGPKRWTGKGPRPARHIPWPEIFKHHLSVVEGHHKMIDMVRKHTQEGSGNWNTITAMLDRCNEMLSMTKKASRDFVPPADNFDQVPIGSSSASMYPGYSPADHAYGEAAAEYGQYAVKAQKDGIEPVSRPDGPEYQIGQKRQVRQEAMSKSRAASGGYNPTDANTIPLGKPKIVEPQESDANPYFVIDTNPTPINAPLPPVSDAKSGAKKAKKEKKPSPNSTAVPEPSVTESELKPTVKEKKKAKEDKKSKEEKKRKREEEEAAADAAAAAESTDATKADDEGELPKKKKSKNSSPKDTPIANGVAEDGAAEKKKKKEKKDKKAKKEKKKAKGGS